MTVVSHRVDVDMVVPWSELKKCLDERGWFCLGPYLGGCVGLGGSMMWPSKPSGDTNG